MEMYYFHFFKKEF